MNDLLNNVKYSLIFDGIDDLNPEREKLTAAIGTMMNSGVVQTGKDNADENTVEAVKTKWLTRLLNLPCGEW